MKKVLFVSDFFAHEMDHSSGAGGAEKSDEALIQRLSMLDVEVERVKSNLFNGKTFGNPLIVSNIRGLSKDVVVDDVPIIAIQHDYQHLVSRNPYDQSNDLRVVKHIVDLFKRSHIVCQTKFHSDMFSKYITEYLSIHNFECTTFSSEEVITLKLYGKRYSPQSKFLVLRNPAPLKGYAKAYDFAIKSGLSFDTVMPCPQIELFDKMTNYLGLIFFPLTPETCCRLVVEAKAIGLSVITTMDYGATSSSWFSLKGHTMIDFIDGASNDNAKKIIGLIS